jgi:hypothetical protein
LWRQVDTALTDLVLAVVTLAVVSRDVTGLAERGAGTAEATQRQPHPGELPVLADVAVLPVHLLRGYWSFVQ